MNSKYAAYSFYDNVEPIKITKAGDLKLHSKSWGLLSEYYLESVKINNRKNGTLSVATLRIGDISGSTTCVVKGLSVSMLFGLNHEEWKEVENMCAPGQQLYYRYFKDGISSHFGYEQKLFYNFCASHQLSEVLVAKFIRCPNTRTNFKHEALIEVLELRKCDIHLMDLYTNSLRKNNL